MVTKARYYGYRIKWETYTLYAGATGMLIHIHVNRKPLMHLISTHNILIWTGGKMDTHSDLWCMEMPLRQCVCYADVPISTKHINSMQDN
jgi:hypothetical protein